jgi:hypothetical protein
MSKSKSYRGKCPRCCPDGGAYFRGGFNESMEWGKVCTCCGHWRHIRATRIPSRPNARQQRIIDKIVALFGGRPELTMHGRKAWLSPRNYEGRHWADGQALWGTIGPRGAIKLSLARLGDDITITDMIGVEVYLQARIKPPATA